MSAPEIRTSRQIRQDFLDFFKSKEHTLVPSSSLMPDAPNLLFTNAGMNQFVPIFLGERKADVSRWPGAIAGSDTRAADTQKCIRAGGKHNDLDDVGLDTYHHTFFEMLGNWSFGDYFKREAITWAWELLTGVWGFPKERLYATVYKPGEGDPADFDQEAYDYWAEIFTAAGLDPKVHIVYGNKKDNFWMMGNTGPCGPCSEVHIDLTEKGDTQGSLVNTGTADCIEIWNLVFIQFNANEDGTYVDLPAKHVDTGMGFERVCSVVQNTKAFTDFSKGTSNYNTDVFRPLFDRLEELSGKKYTGTLPKAGSTGDTEQEKIDVAFRVIGDHIRTLSFSIADGIIPGKNEREYVLRRILRRAVRYGRTLGFHEPFFYKVVDTLVDCMGEFFPELRKNQALIKETIKREEIAFNKTLDRGIDLFNSAVETGDQGKGITGEFAFELYDTYGFPSDLTELMARERGISVDIPGYKACMEEQKERARKARKTSVIEVSDTSHLPPTKFVGYEKLDTNAKVLEVVTLKGKTGVILETSPFYAAMGGQLGDSGEIGQGSNQWRVVDTQKAGDSWVHVLADDGEGLEAGMEVELSVDETRRDAIQRHHTVTHVFHWALHEVVSKDATQKGSYVGPEKLTFDFNCAPLTDQQVADIEKVVNERVLDDDDISWNEFPYSEVRENPNITALFGEKYGEKVRVVQIGGEAGKLNGWSMELCGGTHTRRAGEVGLFRITGESAISAGVRRVEAVAGLEAYDLAKREAELIQTLAGKMNSPIGEIERKLDNLLAQQKQLEKQLRAIKQKQAGETARALKARAEDINGIPSILVNLGEEDGGVVQTIANTLAGAFNGVVVLLGHEDGKVTLIACVSKDLTKRIQAGNIIKVIAPLVGGKGGGKPEQARGGGSDPSGIDAALAETRKLIAGA